VILTEAVDRYGDADVPEGIPLGRDWNDAACHDQRLDALRAQFGKDATEFAVTHQWFAADDREMDGAVPGDQSEDALNELVPTVVVQLPERDAPTEMSFFVCVAPRAAQRALSRDFDRQHRGHAEEHSPTGGEEPACVHSRRRSAPSVPEREAADSAALLR